MGTRSTIAYYENGEIFQVYCHWDGYLSGNGKTLVTNYNSLEKIKELFSYGDMSSLDNTIDECQFYASDRNEPLEKPRVVKKEVSKINEISLDDLPDRQEYDYLFFDGKWFWFLTDDDCENGKWTYLSTNIINAIEG